MIVLQPEQRPVASMAYLPFLRSCMNVFILLIIKLLPPNENNTKRKAICDFRKQENRKCSVPRNNHFFAKKSLNDYQLTKVANDGGKKTTEVKTPTPNLHTLTTNSWKNWFKNGEYANENNLTFVPQRLPLISTASNQKVRMSRRPHKFCRIQTTSQNYWICKEVQRNLHHLLTRKKTLSCQGLPSGYLPSILHKNLIHM